MRGILISYKDNPSFSLYKTDLGRGRNLQALGHKNWIGFDENGQEKLYTNVSGVEHIFIQDCSLDEFCGAVTSESVKFRIVEKEELTKIQSLFCNRYPAELQLDI